MHGAEQGPNGTSVRDTELHVQDATRLADPPVVGLWPDPVPAAATRRPSRAGRQSGDGEGADRGRPEGDGQQLELRPARK